MRLVYRGYVLWKGEKGWWANSGSEGIPCHDEPFPSEEAAMKAVDGWKRQQREGGK